MKEYTVGSVDEIPVGSSKIVKIGKQEIGIYNVNGEFYAVRNLCPHKGAPLCRGLVSGTTLPSKPNEYLWGREGEILRCPWHGWEFDLQTGISLIDPNVRARTYPVEVRGNQIVLILLPVNTTK